MDLTSMATLVFENKEIWNQALPLIEELRAEGHQLHLLAPEDSVRFEDLQKSLGAKELVLFVGFRAPSVAAAQKAGWLGVLFKRTPDLNDLRQALHELLQ